MSSIALVLNVCIPLLAGNGDSCDGYIVDTFPQIADCVSAMHDNPQTRDDRFLSCALVDDSLLTDRRDGRSVKQIIADLNSDL